MSTPKRGCGSHVSKEKQAKINARVATVFLDKVRDSGAVIYIPVVINMCDPDYNPKDLDADTKYTIDSLNKAYSGVCPRDYTEESFEDPGMQKVFLDYTSRVGSANVFFYLDTVHFHELPSFDTNDMTILNEQVKKEVPPVSPQSKLNLWIVSLSSGLLGYAQFPWELAKKPDTDGVIIASGAFGKKAAYSSYNRNCTAFHEIGHWLGLWHIFTPPTVSNTEGVIDIVEGDSKDEVTGDQIVDTPSAFEPCYGNPFTAPGEWPSCMIGGKTVYSMFFNFMDYVDDCAMFMFTKDQCIRMRTLIHLYRPGLLQNKLSVKPARKPRAPRATAASKKAAAQKVPVVTIAPAQELRLEAPISEPLVVSEPMSEALSDISPATEPLTASEPSPEISASIISDTIITKNTAAPQSMSEIVPVNDVPVIAEDIPQKPKTPSFSVISPDNLNEVLRDPSEFSLYAGSSVSPIGGHINTGCFKLLRNGKITTWVQTFGKDSVVAFYYNTSEVSTFCSIQPRDGRELCMVALPATNGEYTKMYCSIPQEYSSDYIVSWNTAGVLLVNDVSVSF